MKFIKYQLFVCILAALSLGSQARTYSWKRTLMDGSRTGVTAPGANNVTEALGTVRGNIYIAPSGKRFKGGVTPGVAAMLTGVQDDMARVKEVIAYAPRAMERNAPECELSDWFIDVLMDACRSKGRQVDVGITNFGGIRVDMPQGDVLLDDILSMFPFKNNLCYIRLKGKDLRKVLEGMAADRFQIIGGMKCVAKDGKLVSALIDGKPISDNKVYGLCTISFLLNGGDGLSLARNAVELEIFDEYIIDVVLPAVRKLTAEGKPLEYHTDGRVTIL